MIVVVRTTARQCRGLSDYIPALWFFNVLQSYMIFVTFATMELHLPNNIDRTQPSSISDFSQITLIGANGSGKTRFMNKLMEDVSESAVYLSAIDAFYPHKKTRILPSGIDAMYKEAMDRLPYLNDEGMSEFDKLMFLLIDQECACLLNQKSRRLFGADPGIHVHTNLDTLIEVWQSVFPDNHILRYQGELLFSNSNGNDKVRALKLSKGEKTALYFIAASIFAPQGAIMFIDAPDSFLNPSLINNFWNAIEGLRPDCKFIYNTYDISFVASRTENLTIWIRSFSAENQSWDYQFIHPGQLPDDLLLNLIGPRRPVLFIEGDETHSLDAKLYTLVFSDYVVRPLGSCDKVIESTRAFSSLKSLHHLNSRGLVDRDRRTCKEIEYLRKKNILVPEVAEIENLFLLRGVIEVMAAKQHRNPDKTFAQVKNAVMKMWGEHLEAQALQHTRHRIKRLTECRIDGRFKSIEELEEHIRELPSILKPEQIYSSILDEFIRIFKTQDYSGVLKVFNHKPMLSASGVASHLGYPNTHSYIKDILASMKFDNHKGPKLRACFRNAFLLKDM